MAALYLTLLVVLLSSFEVEGAAYGAACTVTTAGDKGDCDDAHGACSATSSGTCGCATNYVASAANACLLKSGQTCTVDADCTTNSACPSSGTKICTCSTNYVAQTSGVCSPNENAYGGSCTITSSGSVDSCVTTGLDPNAVCSAASGGTCGCKSGYTATVGAKCLLKSGQTGCTADAQCTANSVCSTGTTRTCTCSTNYVAQTTSGLCAPKDNAYGGSCTITSSGSVDSCVTTGSDPNAVCSAASGGTCGCKSGYTATVGAKCLLKSGQTCTADAQCTANSVCSTGTTRTCTCSTNYVAQTTSGLCAPKDNAYGGSCTITSSGSVDSCVTTGLDPNAVCSAASGGTCGCKSGYTATVGAKCLLKSGQTCTADAQCTANSVCSTGTTRTCTCSTNYFAQTSGLCAPKDNAYGGSCTITSSVDSCVTTGLDPNAVCSASSGGTCGCKSGYTATVGAKCSGAMNFAGSVFLLVAALILTTYLQ